MNELQLYHVLLVAFFVLAAITFPVLFFVTAPYGRYTRGRYGPKLDRRLGWIIMEAPSGLLYAACFLLGDHRSSAVALIFLLLWEVHYTHRAYIFPFRLRGELQRLTLTTVALAVVFNLFNGYLNGRYLNSFAPPYPTSWLTDPRFVAGVALFALGFAINLQADTILINLRQPGETGYKIPRGGLFRLVSCPNYLGEMLEWTGWAIATWSVPGLAFAVWTAANLLPRAWSHHRWYRDKFPEYPTERRAVIPFLL